MLTPDQARAAFQLASQRTRRECYPDIREVFGEVLQSFWRRLVFGLRRRRAPQTHPRAGHDNRHPSRLSMPALPYLAYLGLHDPFPAIRGLHLHITGAAITLGREACKKNVTGAKSVRPVAAVTNF